jgi:hypothetical protein
MKALGRAAKVGGRSAEAKVGGRSAENQVGWIDREEVVVLPWADGMSPRWLNSRVDGLCSMYVGRSGWKPTQSR